MAGRWWLGLAIMGAGLVGLAGGAAALESPQMFVRKIDTHGGRTVSRRALDAYVDKRFDLLAGKRSKTISRLELKGRLPQQGFMAARKAKPNPDPTLLSRAQFKAYADRLFTQANTQVGKGGTAAQGTLSLDELQTTAGKKLIRLLE